MAVPPRMDTPTTAPRPAPDRLTDRVAKSFPPHACVRGFAAFRRDQVALVAADDARTEATVRTKRTHRVLVQAAEGALLVACSCPARSLGYLACKHAWAALLEIDRRGALAAARASRGPLRLAALDEAAPAEGARARARKARRSDEAPAPAERPPKRPATDPRPGRAGRAARAQPEAAGRTAACTARSAGATRPGKSRKTAR